MRNYSLSLILFSLSVSAFAGIEKFSLGPVVTNFGENAVVEGWLDNPSEQKFSVAFDIAKGAENNAVNRSIASVARFINMHTRAGVPVEKIKTVLIVHGPAATEMLSAEAYKKRFNKANPSLALLETLIDHGAQVILCGQSAAFSDIAAQDLIPGVQMSLSAMTAHALYQQRGYTLNPF